jgi:hypothetical protein
VKSTRRHTPHFNSVAVTTNTAGYGCILDFTGEVDGMGKLVVVKSNGDFVRHIKLNGYDEDVDVVGLDDMDRIFTASDRGITMYNKFGKLLKNIEFFDYDPLSDMNSVLSMSIDKGIVYLLYEDGLYNKFVQVTVEGEFGDNYTWVHGTPNHATTECSDMIVNKDGCLLIAYNVVRRDSDPNPSLTSIYVAAFQPDKGNQI